MPSLLADDKWVEQRNNTLWTFRVSDMFGDSGLTGIISFEENSKKVTVVDFVLSCRVFGRKIEETMIYTVIDYAKSKGLKGIVVKFIQTEKNKPCLRFWKNSGFEYNKNEDIYYWKLKKPLITVRDH